MAGVGWHMTKCDGRSESAAHSGLLYQQMSRHVQAEGFYVVPNPHSAAFSDSVTKQCLEELAGYAVSVPRAAGSPLSFLLATGKSAGSTTGTDTELRYAEVPGARQHFRSREELQVIVAGIQVCCKNSRWLRYKLRLVYSAITGQNQLPNSISSPQEVTIRPEFESVAGKTLVYSGEPAFSLCYWTCV